MQITATFDTYEEMMDFAAKLQKEEKAEKKETEHPVSDKASSVIPDAQPAPAGAGSVAPLHAPVTQPVQTPTAQPVQTPTAQPVQTSAPSYTLDSLSVAAMTLMDRGMQQQLQQLLAGYGVASLPELPKEQYGAFATALRGMGAQI